MIPSIQSLGDAAFLIYSTEQIGPYSPMREEDAANRLLDYMFEEWDEPCNDHEAVRHLKVGNYRVSATSLELCMRTNLAIKLGRKDP